MANMNKSYTKLQIIDDTIENNTIENDTINGNIKDVGEENKPEKKVRKRTVAKALDKYLSDDKDTIEIGVDEAGRGPMLGRVYTAAVILPKDDSFNHSIMKDSKKFHSEKKIKEVAEYIKNNALSWCVTYSDESEIDELNIRNATHKSMHSSIKGVMNSDKYSSIPYTSYQLLIDGNDFKPLLVMDDTIGLVQIHHTCIEGGDNKYSAIAAASILAKVTRDAYIEELCKEHNYLITNYDLLKNKGYGTAKHMEGIRTHGISPFHRKSFGICRDY